MSKDIPAMLKPSFVGRMLFLPLTIEGLTFDANPLTKLD